MAKRLDIIGKTFGELTVRAISENREWGNKNVYHVLCDCSCGKKDVPAYPSSLTHGNKISCGHVRDSGSNRWKDKRDIFDTNRFDKQQTAVCLMAKRFYQVLNRKNAV